MLTFHYSYTVIPKKSLLLQLKYPRTVVEHLTSRLKPFGSGLSTFSLKKNSSFKR